MNKNKIMQMVSSNYKFFRFVSCMYAFICPKNKLHAKRVKLSHGVTLLDGLKIYNYGENNQIVLGDYVRIRNCTIIIRGSYNKIFIGDFSFLNQTELYIENENNEILIGKHTNIHGPAHFAAIEGTKILIGDNCLFSSDLHFRTGDSHSILDMQGKRINASQDIVIENHVWVGTKVTCLKGVYVAQDSIVAATTTLCKKYEQKNCVIAGVPGKIVKTGVNWDSQRIAIHN